MYPPGSQGSQPGHVIATGDHPQIGLVLTLEDVADGNGLTVTTGSGLVGGPGDGLWKFDTFTSGAINISGETATGER